MITITTLGLVIIIGVTSIITLRSTKKHLERIYKDIIRLREKEKLIETKVNSLKACEGCGAIYMEGKMQKKISPISSKPLYYCPNHIKGKQKNTPN